MRAMLSPASETGASTDRETLGLDGGVPLRELVLIAFLCPIGMPGLLDDTRLPMLVLLAQS